MIHRHAFWSCDLDLDPMTLIYELDVQILKTYLRTKKNIQSQRRTPPNRPPPPTGEEGWL